MAYEVASSAPLEISIPRPKSVIEASAVSSRHAQAYSSVPIFQMISSLVIAVSHRRRSALPASCFNLLGLYEDVAATPRILIPIMEMYQNKDGTITVPEVLRPYMNGQAQIG